ncbi:flagellar basal body L-ring protein, partial [Rhizobium ruizarguesonis]
MNMRFPAAIAALAIRAGCQSPTAVSEIGRAPAMSPIGSWCRILKRAPNSVLW